MGRCSAWFNCHLKEGGNRQAAPGWGDELPQSPRLPQVLRCEQPAGLFVRELMGQIETSWEMDGQRFGYARTHTWFYKLVSVVVVDLQIRLIATVTQKEVGQANNGGSCRTQLTTIMLPCLYQIR